MAGISGAGIDKMLYPNIYGPEQKMSGAYGRRAGAAAGPQQGSAAGPAVTNFRNITAMDRINGQQQQAQGYGQMLSQLAMLAAYMRQRQQPSLGETREQTVGYQDPFGANASPAQQQYVPMRLPMYGRPRYEPEY